MMKSSHYLLAIKMKIKYTSCFRPVPITGVGKFIIPVSIDEFSRGVSASSCSILIKHDAAVTHGPFLLNIG